MDWPGLDMVMMWCDRFMTTSRATSESRSRSRRLRSSSWRNAASYGTPLNQNTRSLTEMMSQYCLYCWGCEELLCHEGFISIMNSWVRSKEWSWIGIRNCVWPIKFWHFTHTLPSHGIGEWLKCVRFATQQVYCVRAAFHVDQVWKMLSMNWYARRAWLLQITFLSTTDGLRGQHVHF